LAAVSRKTGVIIGLNNHNADSNSIESWALDPEG